VYIVFRQKPFLLKILLLSPRCELGATGKFLLTEGVSKKLIAEMKKLKIAEI
jgi:hypothetical protein